MKIRLIAAGTRIIHDKRYFRYIEINEKCELGWESNYPTKLKSWEGIGTIYEAIKTDTGIKNWKALDEKAPEGSAGFDSILAWSVASREAIETLARLTRMKKQYGRTVDVLIKELKDATWSLNSRQKRAAFARYVYDQLS